MDTENLEYYCVKAMKCTNKYEINDTLDTKKITYIKKTIDNINRSGRIFKYTYNLSKIIRCINKKILIYKKNNKLIKLKKYLKLIYKQICINHSL